MFNFMLVAVICIFAACFYRGSRIGLVKTMFGLFSSIAVLLAGSVISPFLSSQLIHNEKFFNAVSGSIEKSLKNYQGTDYLPAKLIGGGSKEMEGIVSDVLKNKHFKKAKKNIQKEVNHRVAVYLTGNVISSGSFIAVYLFLSTGLYILGRVLRIMSRLPVLKELNQLGGGAIGLFQGLVAVWLIFTLMMVFIDKPFIQSGMEQIEKNAFLRMLYDLNIISRIIGLK